MDDLLLDDIPVSLRERFQEIASLIHDFCLCHLNREYDELCTQMGAELCMHGSTITRGKAAGWAAGIVYSVGRINFLDDPANTPHLTTAQIHDGFGVSQATLMARSRDIRKELELIPMHPDWTLPSRLETNPLVWMLEVNGMLVDIRGMPREAQAVAYEQGLIPYIPADRDEDDEATD